MGQPSKKPLSMAPRTLVSVVSLNPHKTPTTKPL